MTRTFCDSCRTETTDADNDGLYIDIGSRTYAICEACRDTLEQLYQRNRKIMTSAKPAQTDVVSEPA